MSNAYLGGASGHAGNLLLNDGTGHFSVQSDGPWELDSIYEDMGVVLFDSDGDSDLDLYVVSGGVECEPGDEVLQDRLYINDGNGEFANATSDRLPKHRASGSVVAAADYDDDGDLDLFVGGRIVTRSVSAYSNVVLATDTDGGKFVDVTEKTAPDLQNVGLVTGACWTDANGDGTADLVLSLEWGPLKLFANSNGQLADARTGVEDRIGWYHSIAPRRLRRRWRHRLCRRQLGVEYEVPRK